MAVYQIKKAGMTVTDFWSFVKANELLDKLYAFSVKYEKLSPQQQILFLQESEKIFDAFGKVPDALWEEEYQKYMEVLNKYRDIKILSLCSFLRKSLSFRVMSRMYSKRIILNIFRPQILTVLCLNLIFSI